MVVVLAIWMRASGCVTQPRPAKLGVIQNVAVFALAYGLSIGYVHFFTHIALYVALGPAVILAFASNNPPAEPGAFNCEPLKAAGRGR